MKIKSITLQGFRTYDDATTIHLSPHCTCLGAIFISNLMCCAGMCQSNFGKHREVSRGDGTKKCVFSRTERQWKIEHPGRRGFRPWSLRKLYFGASSASACQFCVPSCKGVPCLPFQSALSLTAFVFGFRCESLQEGVRGRVVQGSVEVVLDNSLRTLCQVCLYE